MMSDNNSSNTYMCAYAYRHIHTHISTSQLESGTARELES